MQNPRAEFVHIGGSNVVSSCLDSSAGDFFVIRFYRSNIVSDEQTGLSVPADEIRLVTHHGDPYRWLFLPERKHLFEKPLSKHNTGAYREICSAIGRSIEVRKREDQGQLETASINGSANFNVEPESDTLNPPTFTSTIEALTQRNGVLADKIQYFKTIIEERDQSVAKRQEQCATLEEQLRKLSKDLNNSKHELRESEEKYAQAEQRWTNDYVKLSRCQTTLHELLQTLK